MAKQVVSEKKTKKVSAKVSAFYLSDIDEAYDTLSELEAANNESVLNDFSYLYSKAAH